MGAPIADPTSKPYLFQPGNNANPGGRPKKRPFSDGNLAAFNSPVAPKLLKAMRQAGMDLPDNATWGDAMILRGMLEAVRPGPSGTLARKEIRESFEGKSGLRYEQPVHEGKVEVVVTFNRAAINNPKALEVETESITAQVTTTKLLEVEATSEPEPVVIENELLPKYEPSVLDATGVRESIVDGEFCPWPRKKK